MSFTILLFASNVKAQKLPVPTYVDSINEWHKERVLELLAPKGWLNLEGLFWLHQGVNTFGVSKNNDCVYENPNPSDVFFPDHLGNFIFEGDSVMWESLDKYVVKVNNQNMPMRSKVCVFNDKGLSSEMSWTMSGASYSWTIIKREDKIGVRFRNLKSNNILSFKGIAHFPINEKFKIKAVLQPPVASFLMISNVLGQQVASKNAGKLQFTYQGKPYSLDVIDEGGAQLFITFGDATSGVTTYGAGRFIYIDQPDANGNTFIDFNQAFNPPCAFTKYATCPLPPPQNRLPFPIPAGEKNYGHH
ncbi:MAG: DUF1684 domain-containing protein [Bacteroidetes bacterium]|nr:DUF1684 domain-containing protein [Bacteroidota bacterium]